MTSDHVGVTLVTVSEKHIREGVAGNCHRCPVALAILEAIGDRDCDPMLLEVEWEPYLVVWGRYLRAPQKVRDFLYAFDSFFRNSRGEPKLPKKLTDDLAPFTFSLPSQSDLQWEESCYRCERLFDPSELDEDGVCEECLKAEN
jgi:hypothetical protein